MNRIFLFKKIIMVLAAVILILFLCRTGNPAKASETDESFYDWEAVEDGEAITKYKGSGSLVVVPSEHDGLSVVSAGIEGSYGAFEDHNEITELVLPEGLKRICDEVFWGCSGMTKVWLPQSLERIGSRAFQGCSGITDVYYAGTREQWQTIYIDESLYGNGEILNAVIHFGAVYTMANDTDWSGTFQSSDGQEITVISVNAGEVVIEFYGYSEEGWYSERQTLILDQQSDAIARCPVYNTLGDVIGEDVYTLEGNTIKVDSQSSRSGVYQRTGSVSEQEACLGRETSSSGEPSSDKETIDPTGTFSDEQVLRLRRSLQIPDELDADCVVNVLDQTYWDGAGITIVWVEFKSGDEVIASCYADMVSGEAAKDITAYYRQDTQPEQDLKIYLNHTTGEVYDNFTIGTDITYHGSFFLITQDEAAEFFCSYNGSISIREQLIHQVSITEHAKGKYRLDDITMDDSLDQMLEKLAAKGYRKFHEGVEEDISYYRYMNDNRDVIFIIGLDTDGNVSKVAVRNPVSEDIEMYNVQNS